MKNTTTTTGSDSGFLTIQDALQQGTQLLQAASISAPRLTAEVLLGHATQLDRTYLYAHGTQSLTQLGWIHYGRYLNERLKGKPTQYITHRQEFYGRDFYVDENVLIPRPETEHLVERAIAHVKESYPRRIVDIGTGSGAIAISVALECNVEVVAADISFPALIVAERNRQTHHAKVNFVQADLLTAFAPSSIDLLLSNPPYVPGADAANMQTEVRDWEPHIALFACDDGLEIYSRLIAQAETVIKPGGHLVMELGYRSLDGVKAMLSDSWTSLEVINDLAGWPRTITAQHL